MDSNGGHGSPLRPDVGGFAPIEAAPRTPPASTTVAVVAASRLGAEHRRLGRNNQDAQVVRRAGARVVAVVADGCSMGAYSEVGAHLGTAWLAEQLVTSAADWSTAEGAAQAVEQLGEALDGALRCWLSGLGPAPEVAERYFLFGYLAAVLDGPQLSVFGLGDGVWSVASNTSVLEAGPRNAPPYPAYRVLPAEVLEPGFARAVPTLHHAAPLLPGQYAFVGTDGVVPLLAELPTWLDEAVTWRNPHALARRLAVHERRLLDDTTVVALRRAAEDTSCG